MFHTDARLRRNGGPTFGNFRVMIGESFSIAFCVITIFALIGFASSAGAYLSGKQAVEARSAHLQALHTLIDQSATSSSERKQIASQLLFIEAHGGITDLNVGTDLKVDQQAHDAVQKVALTGDLLDLPVPITSWHRYWSEWVQWVLYGYLVVLSIMSTLVYAAESLDSGRFLVDLNWKRGWPIVFVALTFFPIGWAFYLTSFVRMRVYIRQQRSQLAERAVLIQQLDEAARNGDTTTYDATTTRLENINNRLGYNRYEGFEDIRRRVNHTGDYVATNDRTVKPNKPLVFTHAPMAALACYADMRQRAGTILLQRRLESIEAELEENTDRMRWRADEIKEIQRENIALRADKVRYTELSEQANKQLADDATIKAEFDSLLKLQGVKAARVVNDEISLFVEARFPYNGKVYDLGDWELRFGLSGELTSHELRSGVRANWPGTYPAYRLGGGTFCFGNRTRIIEENLSKGQFLEGIEVAVNCLSSVNERDIELVPKAFYPLKQKEMAK